MRSSSNESTAYVSGLLFFYSELSSKAGMEELWSFYHVYITWCIPTTWRMSIVLSTIFASCRVISISNVCLWHRVSSNVLLRYSSLCMLTSLLHIQSINAKMIFTHASALMSATANNSYIISFVRQVISKIMSVFFRSVVVYALVSWLSDAVWC